jgi:hypothetical protein
MKMMDLSCIFCGHMMYLYAIFLWEGLLYPKATSELISGRAMPSGTTLALGIGAAGLAVRRAAAQTKIS